MLHSCRFRSFLLFYFVTFLCVLGLQSTTRAGGGGRIRTATHLAGNYRLPGSRPHCGQLAAGVRRRIYRYLFF